MGPSYKEQSHQSPGLNTVSKVFFFLCVRVQTFQLCTIFWQIGPSLVKAKRYPTCISLAIESGFQPDQAKPLRHQTEAADS